MYQKIGIVILFLYFIAAHAFAVTNEKETNNTFPSAQVVISPQIINATLTIKDIDVYRIVGNQMGYRNIILKANQFTAGISFYEIQGKKIMNYSLKKCYQNKDNYVCQLAFVKDQNVYMVVKNNDSYYKDMNYTLSIGGINSDMIRPNPPQNVEITFHDYITNKIEVTWSPSVDNLGIKEYQIYYLRDEDLIRKTIAKFVNSEGNGSSNGVLFLDSQGVQNHVFSTTNTSAKFTINLPNMSDEPHLALNLVVVAVDWFGNESVRSNVANFVDNGGFFNGNMNKVNIKENRYYLDNTYRLDYPEFIPEIEKAMRKLESTSQNIHFKEVNNISSANLFITVANPMVGYLGMGVSADDQFIGNDAYMHYSSFQKARVEYNMSQVKELKLTPTSETVEHLFIHELGHTLGLTHQPYKGQPSFMSYIDKNKAIFPTDQKNLQFKYGK